MLDGIDGELLDLYTELRAYSQALGDDVQEKTLKYYVAFKRIKNFACVEVYPSKKRLTVYLKLDPDSLTLEEGFTRDDFYLVLGSSRGTSPGLNYGGFNLPLNPTGPYFRFSIMQPNTSVMVNTFGVLDMQGRATAEVRVPAGLPSLIGIELHHAFVVMNPILGVTAVSNATSLRLGF